jgi:hypothetical protein
VGISTDNPFFLVLGQLQNEKVLQRIPNGFMKKEKNGKIVSYSLL